MKIDLGDMFVINQGVRGRLWVGCIGHTPYLNDTWHRLYNDMHRGLLGGFLYSYLKAKHAPLPS